MPTKKMVTTSTASTRSSLWNSSRMGPAEGATMDEAICPAAESRAMLRTMAIFWRGDHCMGSAGSKG